MLLGISSNDTLKEAQGIARGASVVMFAEFEAFLREVVEDLAYSMEDPWDTLRPFQQRVIATRAMVELGRFCAEARTVVNSPREAAKVALRVRTVAAWFDNPGQFARDVAPPPLGLLGDTMNVGRVLAEWMGQLRDDGAAFDAWLWRHGVDAKAYMQTVSTLINLRNDVAHQNRLGLQPTIEELRNHHKRLAVLARAVRNFVEEDALMGAAT